MVYHIIYLLAFFETEKKFDTSVVLWFKHDDT